MVSTEQATEIIFQNLMSFGTELVPLGKATGRILAQNLVAERPFPPFDRVSMDGIAIRSDDFFSGKKRFKIAGLQVAGQPPKFLKNAGDCLEIMTGAVLPEGSDAVVRYEDLKDGGRATADGFAEVTLENIEKWQNIHRKGIDRKVGDLLVQSGTRISPAEIATAATIGLTKIEVARLPKTAVISTGDELVAVGKTPLPHQIRMSNAHAIHSALLGFGIGAKIFHLPDSPKILKKRLEKILENFPLVILSGAVSKGKLDFLPQILPELGVEKVFHRVAQRPGNPFWFGRRGDENIVFAPPGNPVSTFMVAHRYILPWLRASLGMKNVPPEFAVLTEKVNFRPDLTYFLQVKLISGKDGRLLALPVFGHGSGDLANLNDSDAFLELPRGREVFEAGGAFPIIKFR